MHKSTKNRLTIVIPARYASSRLPGKPLLEILGKPMVQHVYERALLVPGAQVVLVATDDERVQGRGPCLWRAMCHDLITASLGN